MRFIYITHRLQITPSGIVYLDPTAKMNHVLKMMLNLFSTVVAADNTWNLLAVII